MSSKNRASSARRVGTPARIAVAASALAVLFPIGCADVPEALGTRGTSSARGAADASGSATRPDSGPDSSTSDSTSDSTRGDVARGEANEPQTDTEPADGRTTLLASDHPSWERSMAELMCFGNGVERGPSDADKAEQLMDGVIQLGSHSAVELLETPSWDENPFGDDNWDAAYHKLNWLDVLRREGIRTGDQRMLDRWKTLLADWVEQNPRGSSASDWAWREVPTAQRAVVLTCAVAELGAQEWLRQAIQEHGEALTDPKLRVDIGNHAMLQNNGLLAAACLTGNEDWARLAYDDSDRLLGRAVDEQGVTDEGSVDYQNHNYRWWRKAADRLDACGLPPWEHLDRLERMPVMMAHATAPDGTYAMIGDTQLGKARPVTGTVAEYAATQGESGPRPNNRVRVFDRGYAFGRSGWGTERPFDQESYFTLRFGPPRSEQVHGHADHGSITFASHGNTLLYDQGLYAYNGGAMRAHVRSPAGHNTVTVGGAAYDPDASAELVAREETSTHVLFTVRVIAADSTVWTRTLFYSKHGRYLLVDDRVRLPGERDGQGDDGESDDGKGDDGKGGDGKGGHGGAAARTAVQRFHLGSDRKVRVGDDHVHTVGKGTDVGLFWLSSEPALDLVRGAKDPLEGWRSVAYREAEPAPVARAAQTSSRPRFSTVVAPLPGSDGPERVRIDNVTTRADSLDATVEIGDQVEWVQIRPDGATVTPSSWLYDVTGDDEGPARPTAQR